MSKNKMQRTTLQEIQQHNQQKARELHDALEKARRQGKTVTVTLVDGLTFVDVHADAPHSHQFSGYFAGPLKPGWTAGKIMEFHCSHVQSIELESVDDNSAAAPAKPKPTRWAELKYYDTTYRRVTKLVIKSKSTISEWFTLEEFAKTGLGWTRTNTDDYPDFASALERAYHHMAINTQED